MSPSGRCRLRYIAALASILVCALTSFADDNADLATRVTFSGQVQPILNAHCVSCHRPGHIGPMSLRTYEEARPWAKSISRQVAQRTMPPFHAAGPVGRYRNDLRLANRDIDTVVRWVNDGAPRGNGRPSPVVEDTESHAWSAGKPDVVIEFPPVHIEARDKESGPYVHLFTDYVFPEDLWIAGFEWKFRDYRVVHHTLARLLSPGFSIPEEKVLRGNAIRIDAVIGFASWFPGQRPRRYPEGTAAMIERGSRPVVTIHYAPTTEEVVDQPSLGLYLFDGNLRGHLGPINLSVKDTNLLIPAGARNHVVSVSQTVTRDYLVHSFYAHMHYRGKHAEVSFTYPDGERTTVFEIPQYNFDWQRRYELVEPISVPKGTVIEATFSWDNSEANEDNPDPSSDVVFGSNSYDEMGGIQIGVEPHVDHPKVVVVTNGVLHGIDRMAYDNLLSPADHAIAEALRKMDPEKRDRLIKEHMERSSRNP